MPLYEFFCLECNEKKDSIENFNVESIKCPKCGSHMRRLISAPAFHLKGNNWYKDHYGLKKNKKGDKKNGS